MTSITSRDLPSVYVGTLGHNSHHVAAGMRATEAEIRADANFGHAPGVRLDWREHDQAVSAPGSTGSIGPTGAPRLNLTNFGRRASPSSRPGSAQWRYSRPERDDEVEHAAAERRQSLGALRPQATRSGGAGYAEPSVSRRTMYADRPLGQFAAAGELEPGPEPAASKARRRPRPALPPGGGKTPTPGASKRPKQRARAR